MNILLIGSGSREHALAIAIKNSPQYTNLFCLSNTTNPAIKALCAGYEVAPVTDIDHIVMYAEQKNINLAIVGPEAPLELGIADALKAKNIAVVGPTQQHAMLESSKGFTRDLLANHNIDGNPFFQRFTTMDGVEETLQNWAEKFVIKADGLCGGKGVVVWGDHITSMQDAVEHCQDLINNNVEFIIEEKIDGQEFSLISFTDGVNFIHMPAIQDHKRAYENDTGPNTGGMGTYSDANHILPFMSAGDKVKAEHINEQVAKALMTEFNTPYQGILYGGFMATADGVKVIEYNARFGDPEAMNLLTLMQADFVEIATAITDGTLGRVVCTFKPLATVCKYVVPNGYPNDSEKGFVVDISEVGDDVELFMGSVDTQEGQLIAMGSRTIAVLACGESIENAEVKVEKAIANIKGNLFHRPDIGTKALINNKIAHMNVLRYNIYNEL